ncbi:MAG: chorismate lyase [Solimicrobium sp.]|nr:chorismate lyase [Solimicrobium sp.]
MRHWLTGMGSLTAKLRAHSTTFRVQPIVQQHSLCWEDEYIKIGLSKAQKVFTREVLLFCDDIPVIYAHTVLPLNSNASQWPQFKSLGEKSLGNTLFGDPQVKRGTLQFSRLPVNHPAMKRMKLCTSNKLSCVEKSNRPLFARRSLFFKRRSAMLVTELFLPTIFEFNAVDI